MSEPVPDLEIESAATTPTDASASGSTSSADPRRSLTGSNQSPAAVVPDSVRLTELLQKAANEPRQSKWQLELAHQYLAMSQPLLADQAAIRAISLDQQSGEAWALRGELAAANQDWEHSLRCYQQAISADGARADWEYRIASLYEQLGQPRRALSAMERAIELHTDGQVPAELRIRHGRLLAELRQYRRAIEELQAVVADSESGPGAWLVLSEIEALSGDMSQARATLARARELYPEATELSQRQQALIQPEVPVAIVR